MAKFSEPATEWPHFIQSSIGRIHLDPVKVWGVIRIVLRLNLRTNLYIEAWLKHLVKFGIPLRTMDQLVEEVGPAILSIDWM
jgi:hypothetical protein